jgi:hypothetical protein
MRKFLNGKFMYGSSYFGCDGDSWIGLPSIELYSIDDRVVFSVFLCEGLIRVSFMTICEFNVLGCECGGGYYRCLCMIWGSYYA